VINDSPSESDQGKNTNLVDFFHKTLYSFSCRNSDNSMKISRKTDYALRALFTLVDEYSGRPISIREISKINNIPKKFLEQIMLDMKEKGWVQSIPGQKGGYHLAKEPSSISLGEIVRHFDGVLAPIPCVSITKYESCTLESTCRFRRVFLDIRDFTLNAMMRASLDQVAKWNPVTHNEVMKPVFTEGAGI
jgi:Rrf2 family protein